MGGVAGRLGPLRRASASSTACGSSVSSSAERSAGSCPGRRCRPRPGSRPPRDSRRSARTGSPSRPAAVAPHPAAHIPAILTHPPSVPLQRPHRDGHNALVSAATPPDMVDRRPHQTAGVVRYPLWAQRAGIVLLLTTLKTSRAAELIDDDALHALCLLTRPLVAAESASSSNAGKPGAGSFRRDLDDGWNRRSAPRSACDWAISLWPLGHSTKL